MHRLFLVACLFIASVALAADQDSVPSTAAGTSSPTPLRVFPTTAPVLEPRSRPAPRPELEPLLAELRGSKLVGGKAVGWAGVESTFHEVGTRLLPQADLSLLRWLAADENATIRAMGLWGLALRRDLETLSAHYCDRDIVLLCPRGCMCWESTVGEIAQTFARIPAWLGRPGSGFMAERSLPGRRAERMLEVQLAAVDACRTATILAETGAPPTRWTWAAVRAAAPSLPAWMAVKAIARNDAAPVTKELARILEDDSLPADARLAAASGLTRQVSVEAEAAMTRARNFLESQGAGLTERFNIELSMRKRVRTMVERLEPMRTYMERETQGDQVLELYKLHHALVLELPSLGFGNHADEINRARGQEILWVARHLGEYRECWDQYRRTAYELEFMVGRQEGWEREAILTPDELAEVISRVQTETSWLDADVRCRPD